MTNKHSVYEVTCKCGITYTGETGRPLWVRIDEHHKAVSKGDIDKSKIAHHIWNSEGDHMAMWDDIKIIDKERGWKERKIKEAAHIAMSATCISQPSADISPMWLPLLGEQSIPRIQQFNWNTPLKNKN